MEGMLGNDDAAESISATEARRTGRDGWPVEGAVEVSLENESVWSRFHSLGTEMILTKPGRRMFPCCRFRLRGLDPHLGYALAMDFSPLDDFRHRWNGKTWERDGAAEPHPERPQCFHPDSPAPGQRWMDGPVSFYKVKLALSSVEPDSGARLHPMRRYQPRLLVFPAGACPERSAPLHVFTFPQTEFYAVTSYQNPAITRLKIDCNPFMLAFREDEPSARLIQNKLGLALTGRSPFRPAASERTKSEETGAQHLRPREESGADHGTRPQISRALTGRRRPTAPSTDPGRSAKAKRVYRRSRRMRGAWKAKARWWSRVKNSRAAAARVNSAADLSMQPDLEDVDGVLFVSFTAKEALDVHVGNMRTSPPSHTQPQASDEGLTAAARISEQECVLRQQLKNTQILHPALQQVGLKLSLLDPSVPVDLLYLGVHLPPPSPVLSPTAGHAPFVSRTGKTTDLTRIKGWMEKFSSQSAPDSNLSAFSSDMLDEYLASEGQQISERAAVFSTSSVSPVVYQLPVRSSSYVRTLDSVLQTRAVRPKLWPPRPPASIMRSSSRSTARGSLPVHRPAESSGGARRVRSRRGRKRRRPQLSFNREAADGSHSELWPQEEHAVCHGQSPTYITSERASFALSSLLTAEGTMKTPHFSSWVADGDACAQDFCRLGCVCDSLNRKLRGSTHCGRVQCMFGCGCFKHKILLIRSPEPSHTRPSGLMAFPIADTGLASRPAPALRVTRLWQRSGPEDDPEPLLPPKASGVPRRALAPRPRAKVQEKEKEKDPVYLYLESMMTCARVREYNSNPPPQVHLLPPKRPDETVNGVSQPHLAEGRLASPGVTTAEPTKVLEIISGCNWESHRSLVLKELFRLIHMNQLSSVHCIDVYKVELLSQNLKTDETGSALTYKVCVSLAKKPEKTQQQHAPRLRNPSSRKVKVKEGRVNGSRGDGEQPLAHFPLLSRVVPAGYLKAEKKTPELSNPIKVNGKTYAQAKLLLGRMGALHPANRLAAYITGQIKPIAQNTGQGRSLSRTQMLKEARRSGPTPASDRSKRTVSKEAFKAPAAQTLAIYKAPDGIKSTPTLFIFSHVPNPASTSNHVTPSKPGLVLNAASKSETVLPASALPPGQQVVLQPVAGMTGVNLCQFNGQTIQLMPVPAGQEAQATRPQTNPAPAQRTAPFLAPTNPSVPRSSSFTIGGQSGSLAKNNMFSFRICPPAAEGLERTESGGAASSLLLPGGYRLIKLPSLVQPGVNPESGPSVSEKPAASSTGNPTSDSRAEEPTGPQPIKTEPQLIKTEPHSGQEHPSSDAEHEDECVRIKIEPDEETSEANEDSLKMEEADRDIQTAPVDGQPVRAMPAGFSCPLFVGSISALSKRSFPVPILPAQAKTPEEPLKHAHACATPADAGRPFSRGADRRPEAARSRIAWLWKRSSDGPRADPDDPALMYSSDGWSTEDSTEKSSEDEVDIEALEERDERSVCRLRAKARRNTRRAAPHQALPKAKLVGVSHHAVRLMSDLPLYKRTCRLNRALRERRRQVELQQSLDSLRRTLSTEEHDSMSTEALFHQARHVIGALEDRSRTLVAQRRALLQQNSLYQTLISQHSVAGTEVHQQEAAAPPAETPRHNQSVVKRPSPLPRIVLQSFSVAPGRPHECGAEAEASRDAVGSGAGVVLHHRSNAGKAELSGVQPKAHPLNDALISC